jgi:hypothetical protein
MYDVITRMKQAIELHAEADSLRVPFTFPDRALAQRVVADLVSGLVGEHARFRTTQATMTLRLMQESAEAAAVEMEAARASLRAAQANGRPTDRLTLDAEIARRRYESLSARRADAEMLDRLERQQQGPYWRCWIQRRCPQTRVPLPFCWQCRVSRG